LGNAHVPKVELRDLRPYCLRKKKIKKNRDNPRGQPAKKLERAECAAKFFTEKRVKQKENGQGAFTTDRKDGQQDI